MNHLFTRPGGVWANDTDLLAAELADIDDKSTHSIDDRGGAYALEEPMIIGGAVGTYIQFDVGLTLSDPLFMTGGVESYGPVYFGGSGELTIDKDAHFLDAATFEGNADFNFQVFFHDDVTVDAGAFFNFDGAYFDGEVTFGNHVIFSDTVDFNLGADFNDQATFHEQVVFQAPIVLTGEARIQQRQAIGGDADATYQAKSYTHVHVKAATLTANRSYTIGDTGALNGDRLRFSTADDNFGITIKTPGGTTLTAIKGDALTWIDAERVQGEWIYLRGALV